MKGAYDLAVIGAGPAGMSAAIEARRHGLNTVLIDEQARPGGQIYRNVSVARPKMLDVLGPDYAHGRSIVDLFSASGTLHIDGASVWDVGAEGSICYLKDGRAGEVAARTIVVATGAMERPSPLPGWTLPGVMNAGAAQILMKTSGVVPTGPVVLVGCGPLVLLVATQLIDAGSKVAAIVDTGRPIRPLELARFLPGALQSRSDLIKGLRLMVRLKRTSTELWRADGEVHIEGDAERKIVRFKSRGDSRVIDAATVLLHHGVVPNTQMTRMLGLEHEWNPDQRAWQPRTGRYGMSSRETVFVAGDGSGIGGARVAEASGRLAAIGAALVCGALDEDQARRLGESIDRLRRRRLGIRPLLDYLYAPPSWIESPGDDVIVCRCEEVSAGRIRQMASLSCAGPNQTKFFSRCGMGPCQGRMCGATVARILADANGKSIDETGYYRIRSPLKPVPLGALATSREFFELEVGNDGE